MKDYSAMSDYEINLLVNRSLGLKHYPNEEKKVIEVFGDMVIFDPCNNPADAWPIIIANEIGFEKETRICCDHCNELYTTEMWEASHATECHSAEHVNPLRACMIVYLMSKESWSSHG